MLFRSFFAVLAFALAGIDAGGYSTVEPELDASKHDDQFFTFVTRPDIDAPRWDITVYNESAVAPGYWFVAPYGVVDQDHAGMSYVGPYIYTPDGELIWAGAPLFEQYSAFSFKVSEVHGRDMLTALYPHGNEGWILTDEYEDYQRIPAGIQRVTLNMHEFRIVDNGTRALYLMKESLTNLENAQAVGYEGGECEIMYHGIEEVDLDTGDITFKWDSKPETSLDESYIYEHDPIELCKKKERDWMHANAVEKLPSGDYLFSARYADTIYKVSKEGQLVWRLGGRRSDFQTHGHWSGQHDVRCQFQNSTHMTITILDNAYRDGYPLKTNGFSRGLVISVNEDAMTAEVIQTYDHPKRNYAKGKGSFQTLPNGNALLFWRDHALCSEYTPDGTLIQVAKLIAPLETYRGYKFDWVGRPKTPPDVHSELVLLHDQTTTLVHVSWNGATEVAFWNLYSSPPDREDAYLGLYHRSGFETPITYSGYAQYVVVEGVDHAGNRLGKSRVFQTLNPLGLDTTNLQTGSSRPSIVSTDTSELFSSDMFYPFSCGILFCAAAILSSRAIRSRWRTRRQRAGPQYVPLSTMENDGDESKYRF